MLLQEAIAMGFGMFALAAFFLLVGVPLGTYLLYLLFRKGYTRRTMRTITPGRQLLYIFLSLVLAFAIIIVIFTGVILILDHTVDFSSM